MDEMNITEHIAELEREIAALPPGSITPKKIRGKDYFYHRYNRTLQFDGFFQLMITLLRQKL